MSLDRRTWIVGAATSIACWACKREPEDAIERSSPSSDGEVDSRPRDPEPPVKSLPTGHRSPPPGLPTSGEPAQDFATFLAEPRRAITPDLRTLELLPIGEYPRGFVVEYERVHLVRSPELELLRRFASAWFGLEVRVLPASNDEWLEGQAQREFEGRRQFDAEAMLEVLAPRRSPDAHSLLALTLEDLWAPSLDGVFVFGLADIGRGVAVHSMLRYDPGLELAENRPPHFEQIIRDRGLRVLVHELGHLLGLRHCVHFDCVMNPTAGLEGLDRLPLHPCPICLDKLTTATGTDRAARAQALHELYIELGMDEEREWIAARMAEGTNG